MRPAGDENDTKRLLKAANVAADRTMGHAELVGGEREAHVPRGGVEALEEVQGRQITLLWHSFFSCVAGTNVV